MIITEEYLLKNPDHIFVFGDNLPHKGTGGAAALRHLKNTHGFITKKQPNNESESFYTPEQYVCVYFGQINTLRQKAIYYSDKTFLISKLGAGLANKFNIFEKIIEPTIKILLSDLPNVKFLW